MSWWLILLLVWLAPAALASLGMLWCGWVAPALIRPAGRAAREIAMDRSPEIRLPAERAGGEAAGGDRLHEAARPLPGLRRSDAPTDPCIDLASA